MNVDELVARSAAPPNVRNWIVRCRDEVPDRAAALLDDEPVAAATIRLVAASRSLARALLRDAGAADALRAAVAEPEERGVAVLHAELVAAAAAGPEDAATTLRVWKRRAIVHLATRDLDGTADLPVVGRELAAIAQVALERALEITEPRCPLALIGMGKLGGRELNYSSDVDILFVHDGDGAAAERAARAVMSVMTAPNAEGIVFRTDANLRPEGRSGALSRTIEGFSGYYERWARTWELQALIKARPVAGDRALGDTFTAMAEPFVWPEVLDPDAVREVREMKARSEGLLARKGLSEREVKRGRGGIRDIEFAVQLLQMVHGRADPTLRSPNTLKALAALADGGYVEPADATRLDHAYRFLRTVEHRLQLADEQQTHTVPADADARTTLARVLGYRDEQRASALEQFDGEYRSRQATVRRIHEALFFAPLLDTLAGHGPLAPEALDERLSAFGFTDAGQTHAALRELTAGLTRRSRVMQQLLPVLVEWCSASPDPDLALLQLRRLVEGEQRSRALAMHFRESPLAAERACLLLGSSRLVGDALRRNPEFVDRLDDLGPDDADRSRDALVAEAFDTMQWRAGEHARQAGLRRFKRRELLRIAACDLLGLAPLEAVGEQLTRVGEACLEGALRSLEPQVPFTVVAMGRFGGGELSYASDLDVLFLYDGDGPEAFAEAERVASALMREIGATTAEGQTFAIDADLRPEGKDGVLARSLDGYRLYYERWALTWEFQALLRARVAAGDRALGGRFLEMVHPFVYRDPLPPDVLVEVRRMKARIERERIPHHEDPQFHLKLGRGSLSDVEWTLQLLQLLAGADHPPLQTPSTLGGLAALAASELVDRDDVETLVTSYRFCDRARNLGYLLLGNASDSLPVDGAAAVKLGRMMGYMHRPRASLRDDYRRVTRRARKVVERLFYGAG